MQKRILPIILMLTIALLVIVGATTKPFNIMVTMAQQFTDGNAKENSDLKDNKTKENPAHGNQNNNNGNNNQIDNNTTNNNNGDNNKNNNQQPTKPEAPKVPKENAANSQDSELAFDKTTLINENGKQIVTNVDSLLVLVNKKRSIPADYKPKNMVIPDVKFSFEGNSPKKYLREDAARALEELFQDAQKEELVLLATSGYRSYETQKRIFENKAKAIGEKAANMVSAYPGQSEHQTGLAMDLTCPEASFRLVESFGETKEGIWVNENAHKYGFIVRYQKGKEEITGYSYEPWHIRYVGKEVAKYVFENNITLEEYFAEIYDYLE
ncbi:MAG: M15 family metallopeptidase [Bacillota bacterium]|jgi:D-alanyl-D-alanine carboxypeptidase